MDLHYLEAKKHLKFNPSNRMPKRILLVDKSHLKLPLDSEINIKSAKILIRYKME